MYPCIYVPARHGEADLSVLAASALACDYGSRPNHETDSKHAQIDDDE